MTDEISMPRALAIVLIAGFFIVLFNVYLQETRNINLVEVTFESPAEEPFVNPFADKECPYNVPIKSTDYFWDDQDNLLAKDVQVGRIIPSICYEERHLIQCTPNDTFSNVIDCNCYEQRLPFGDPHESPHIVVEVVNKDQEEFGVYAKCR